MNAEPPKRSKVRPSIRTSYLSRMKAMAKQTMNNVKPPRKYFILKGFGESKLPRTRAPKVNLSTSYIDLARFLSLSSVICILLV